MMTILLVLFSVGLAQTGPAEQPRFPIEAGADSVDQVSIFRPKVVVHREIMIPKDPFLGGALSLVLPGTGQAYCGKWLKGAGFLLGTLLSYSFAGAAADEDSQLKENVRGPVGGGFLLLGLGLHAWSVIDGVNTANAHNRRLVGSP
ncbi:MAG: hypothetical protein JSU73_10480 [candidate division WOR-3 bacterium]|nr:MAG: hypothetical protein JSU73_10480 [candidate division WOR-3 bacterium]